MLICHLTKSMKPTIENIKYGLILSHLVLWISFKELITRTLGFIKKWVKIGHCWRNLTMSILAAWAQKISLLFLNHKNSIDFLSNFNFILKKLNNGCNIGSWCKISKILTVFILSQQSYHLTLLLVFCGKCINSSQEII